MTYIDLWPGLAVSTLYLGPLVLNFDPRCLSQRWLNHYVSTFGLGQPIFTFFHGQLVLTLNPRQLTFTFIPS